MHSPRHERLQLGYRRRCLSLELAESVGFNGRELSTKRDAYRAALLVLLVVPSNATTLGRQPLDRRLQQDRHRQQR